MPKEINNQLIEIFGNWSSKPRYNKFRQTGIWRVTAERWQNAFSNAPVTIISNKIATGTTVEPDHVIFVDSFHEIKAVPKIPVSQMIDELQAENKTLSKEIAIQEAQIRKLKQILRDAYKPRILKKISIHGLIVSSISLFISFIYSFNIIHPILAGPMLVVSILLLIMSVGLEKRRKAIA